jgi:phenylacetic acid degradation operon negative regulatory protein
VRLTPGTEELLRTGAARIYGFGKPWEWNGEWLLVVLRVPEVRRELRHRLRTQFAWAGLGSLGGGVWVTPHVDREGELKELVDGQGEADVVSFQGRIGSFGDPRRVAEAAWDLDAVAEHYDQFYATFRRTKPTSPASTFRLQTELVHEWRKFPFIDPDLPEELLHWGLRRRKADALFRDRHDRWERVAREYFESLEDGVMAPGAAA